MDSSIIPVIAKLETLFQVLNEQFYENELPTPVIVASTTGKKRAFGWCTAYRAWTDKTIADVHSPSDQLTDDEIKIINHEDGYFEINICAEYLDRDFLDICETMMHEMVHLYCAIHDIHDTTQNGVYHNKNYKEAAEKHGLDVKRSKYGYCETSLTYEAIEFLKTLDQDRFVLHRRDPKSTEKKKAKQSLRKYMCPSCQCIIRASHDVKVICSECDQLFLLVQKNEETGEETLISQTEQPEELTEIPTKDLTTEDPILADVVDMVTGQVFIPDQMTSSTLSTVPIDTEEKPEAEKQAS